MSLSLRPKVDTDRPTVVALMERTHAQSGYPLVWPSDPDGFANSAQERAAWVAVGSGRVVGHVALHDAKSDPVLPVAAHATGLDAPELAVIARLLVDPPEQGSGIGARLLTVATAAAHASGRRPVLDVNQASTGAVAFYEAVDGWDRIGSFEISLPELTIPLWAYAGPPAPQRDS